MAWKITRDFITRKGESSYAVGICGPETATDATIAKLDAGQGAKFRLLDDDGIVYYHGRFIDDADAEQYDGDPEFQPLDNFGAGWAGCTTVEYRDADGKWKAL